MPKVTKKKQRVKFYDLAGRQHVMVDASKVEYVDVQCKNGTVRRQAIATGPSGRQMRKFVSMDP
jgi:hypothetical protein